MKDCDTRYFDPLTGSGQALPRHGMGFWIHEAGWMILDAGWGHAAVRSPFWRAYHNPDAGAAIRVGGKNVPLDPDRVVLIPPLCVFDCVPEAGVRHVWIHFSADAPLMRPVHRVLPLRSGEAEIWAGLTVSLQENTDPIVRFHLARACLDLAWSQLPPAESQAPGSRMRSWLRLIQSRLDAPPSLDEMAKVSAMGRRSFLRWFKEETGRTPADYAMDLRIREACLRLRYSEDSIDEVAEATGFADRHHFSRVFKQRAGMAPATWRRLASD
ncbi:MAG: helix-turn-helix transcriptional regulator [Verrucomicrobia bacterium]|nr:helix-turn-helix transcriptional regulator [Verrucomicrobiota bacterium]MCH8512792.1 AraC family transcriptional regulator [Kiritimatiellia bacterium]